MAAFASLREKAGLPFDHFVVDNGSKDGSLDWIMDVSKPYWFQNFPNNVGISAGSNRALGAILAHAKPYDLIVKFDNDCLVKSANILGQFCEIFADVKRFSSAFVLSPHVEGIINQPIRSRYTMLAGRRIGLTAIVGGLFHVVSPEIYRQYRYPLNLPLARGQDDHFCRWFKRHGGEVGYVEGLTVEHMEGTDGQARRYPEYFKRKWQEEKTIAPSS